MTPRCVLQLALLLCFSTTALSMSYNLLQFRQRNSTSACRELLRQLNGTPEYCLEDRTDFQVPEAVKQPQRFRKEEAVVVIYEMLRQIFIIFQRNFSSTGWDKTIVENLQKELDRQMDRLETFLKVIGTEGNFPRGSRTLLLLRRYYSGIQWYLEAKSYGRCAWTVVQVELRRNLSFLLRLAGYLRD